MIHLSAVVSTQRSGFSALPFQDISCREIFPVIRDLGFEAVELAVRDPFFLDIAEVEAALAASRLRVTALGTGQAYVDEGLGLLSADPVVLVHAVERLKDHIALAALFPGCRVIIGCMRGKFSDRGGEREEGNRQLLSAVRDLAEIAWKKKVGILIEPINRYETEVINTIDECLDFITAVGYDNVKVLADTFHMNIEEPDFASVLRSCGDRLGHVHLADTNRKTPGRGHFDFGLLIRTLREQGYSGDLSFEIVPGADPIESLAEGIQHIRTLV